MHTVLYSVITPSLGRRPKALAQAISSVEQARLRAGDMGVAVEMLVGFDGVEPSALPYPEFVRCMAFPRTGNFGNRIRHWLITMARGERLLFVDDDNALAPDAFRAFGRYPQAELVIGRVDTTRAFREPFLPQPASGKEVIVQGNIDPLCLCASTELVRVRCGGWRDEGGYESDYLNMLRYSRRARRVVFIEDVVGVYDAGRDLDASGGNSRQQAIRQALRSGRALPSAAPWRQHG